MLDQKLTLVLPSHNEADNIEAVVKRALEVLPRVTREHEIIVVNDGSADDTGAIADRLSGSHETVWVVHHPVNRGYGAALTSGFDAATGDAIMFMDSDRQFDIAEINALLPYVPHYDVVAGYRIARQDPLYRRMYGKMFGLSVMVLFGLRVRDIDCAFKIVRAEMLQKIDLTTPGALINTEMLVKLKRRGATIAQVGVHHYPRHAGESSGGSPRVVFRAIGETARLWLRLRRESAAETAGASTNDTVQPHGTLVQVILSLLAAVAGLAWWRRRRARRRSG
ncbi:MAG TPA: glycosyltransferase family 2 protein [Thermomicrobiales bacterium]|nr:glycosyltransferase family 2 protein [Thermomicrobiales bacterium]